MDSSRPGDAPRTALVTGGNTGIGLETAAGLAGRGFRVVFTSRDSVKGAAAAEEIRRRTPGADVAVMSLDLASLASVRSLASAFLDGFSRLDVLVHNAGVWLDRRTVTEDGFETMFQVNHLGPFLLTALLTDRMVASAPSRVVVVSSEAHRVARLDLEDLQSERRFRHVRTYLRTKLCNILFAREAARRLATCGVAAHAVHPGGRPIRTRMARDGDTHGLFALGARISAPLLLSASKGAATTVHVASASELDGRTGEYWVRRAPRRPSRAALDEQTGLRLWNASVRLAGLAR